MATFQPVDQLGFYIGNKEVDLNSDTFVAILTNSTPTKAGTTVATDVTEIATGNGYTTGGVTLTTLSWAETAAGSGIWQWTFDDFSWTAAGGDIAAFRYAVIIDTTPATDLVVGFIDRGSSAVLASGNTITFDVGANGAFRLTVS